MQAKLPCVTGHWERRPFANKPLHSENWSIDVFVSREEKLVVTFNAFVKFKSNSLETLEVHFIRSEYVHWLPASLLFKRRHANNK